MSMACRPLAPQTRVVLKRKTYFFTFSWSVKRVLMMTLSSSAQIYWDLRENIPLLFRKSGMITRLRLTPPGDAYPVFGRLYRLVYSTIENYFTSAGSSTSGIVPRRKILLANKVPYPDLAFEVVVDAQVVGHVIYDLRKGGWRFRPLYHVVFRMVEEEKGFYARTTLDKLARGFVIKSTHITSSNLPTTDEYVALASRDLNFLGVGVVLRGKRIYVLKAWRRVPYSYLYGDPDWACVVRTHREYLEEKEREAVSFLRSLREKYKLPIVVSFSGGKDSLVTLHLALKAFGPEEITVLFNDTGIEFPQTVRYVKEITSKLGLKLVVAEAGDSFWRGVSVMGPPARDFRWCCKVTKFAPTAKVLRNLFPQGVLSLVGQRKFESTQRAHSPRVWRNAWLPNVIAASPIQDWTAMDVWLYILQEKLLPNPLYYYGLDRLGCWLCPACEMGEFELARSIAPDLYEKWDGVLREFSQEQGLSDSWRVYGLWRWIRIPGDIARVVEDESARARRGARVKWYVNGNHVVFTLEKPRQPLSREKLEKILYTTQAYEDVLSVEIKGGELHFDTRNGIEDHLESLARAVIRSFFCVECLECANWCPSGAITLDAEKGGIKVDQSRCTRCGVCNLKCPIADYTLKVFQLERTAHGRLISG